MLMLQQNPVVRDAYLFAFAAHAATGQKRKYSGEPYIVHPVCVAYNVSCVLHTDAMLAAAYLHDVVEDTKVTLDDIQNTFGSVVAKLVSELTNVSKLTDGNREARKRMDRERIAKISPEAKTIKLADILDNTKDLSRADQGWAKKFLEEKRQLLHFLKEGDAMLYQQVEKVLNA